MFYGETPNTFEISGLVLGFLGAVVISLAPAVAEYYWPTPKTEEEEKRLIDQ